MSIKLEARIKLHSIYGRRVRFVSDVIKMRVCRAALHKWNTRNAENACNYTLFYYQRSYISQLLSLSLSLFPLLLYFIYFALLSCYLSITNK